MKLFLFFLVSAFLIGFIGRMKRKEKLLMVCALALFVSFGYFFLDQI
jgi:hypothetical protein